MRASYSSYIAHICRYYFTYPNQTEFKSDCDKLNYQVVDKAYKILDQEEKKLIKRMYLGASMTDTIRYLAKEQKIKERSLWKLITQFEKRVATFRGLR